MTGIKLCSAYFWPQSAGGDPAAAAEDLEVGGGPLSLSFRSQKRIGPPQKLQWNPAYAEQENLVNMERGRALRLMFRGKQIADAPKPARLFPFKSPFVCLFLFPAYLQA